MRSPAGAFKMHGPRPSETCMPAPLAPFESSIAERYHEETKYSEDGLRREHAAGGAIDWTQQPVPFKRYDGPRILLPTEGLPLVRRGHESAGVVPAPRGSMDLAKLARILWHTNGCTRIVSMGGSIHHFRAAPSAGAMYPTEVYVALRGIADIDDGIYDYQVLDHSLARVRTADVWDALTSDRSYRAGMEPHVALAHIVAGSGAHFDPSVVTAFVGLAATWGYSAEGPGDADQAWEAVQTCHEVVVTTRA